MDTLNAFFYKKMHLAFPFSGFFFVIFWKILGVTSSNKQHWKIKIHWILKHFHDFAKKNSKKRKTSVKTVVFIHHLKKKAQQYA